MLSQLAERTGATLIGDDVRVAGVEHDSRRVGAGDLFAALSGASFDGASFAPVAVERGAVAVLGARSLSVGVPQLVSEDVRRAMAIAAHAVAGDPTEGISLIGVTGTNGKTTVAYLVAGMLRALGEKPWMLGTVESRAGVAARPAAHTTPEAPELARFAREAREAGAKFLVMEVSSHGLAQQRVRGARFAVAAFTNLSRDHLDFHGTMEAYENAKASFFTDYRVAAHVIHVGDPVGERIATRLVELGERPLTVARGLSPSGMRADVSVAEASIGRDGIEATVTFRDASYELRSPLVGDHNLENLLVAFGCGLALGLGAERTLAALSRVAGAPGRLEAVPDPRGAKIFVDYAHTPDALSRALAALRPITQKRLMVVFGCGGDRDRGKRAPMGEAAAVGADVLVVTSDNPRTEDPQAIVDDILPGVRKSGAVQVADATSAKGYCVEVDRAVAIDAAVAALATGDTLLIAGKGHEDYQIVGTEKRAFDDRVHARAAVARHRETAEASS